MTPTPKNALVGLLEKVFATYVEAFAALLLVAPVLDVATSTAAAVAAVPAGLTVIANGLPLVPAGLPFYTDLLFRVARTGAASFLGFLVAPAVFDLDISTLGAAVAATIPPMLTVVKGGFSARIGDRETAAALPARLDPSSTPF